MRVAGGAAGECQELVGVPFPTTLGFFFIPALCLVQVDAVWNRNTVQGIGRAEPEVIRYPNKAMFTSPVFLPPKDVGICGDLMFTQYSQILLNTLSKKYSTIMESFSSSQKYTRVEGICGDISGLSPQNPE
jgi:hypothetical protein